MAMPVEDGYLLNGTIPWATGADQSDFIVAGSAVGGETPSQILFILPMELLGVTVETLPLVALASTHTCAVRCENVKLPKRLVLTGPAEYPDWPEESVAHRAIVHGDGVVPWRA